MKLTKVKTKEFFNLIKNENADTFNETMAMLNDHPELTNVVASGMAKGIDGYSSLMLAVNFLKFKFASELIKKGADVNFIDESPVRKKYRPIFIDLLEMLSYSVDAKDTKSMEEGLEVWDLMETYGLDYSKKTISTDGVNRAENCIEAYIRFVSARYGNKDKIHHETKYDPPNPYISKYMFSDKSREVGKEKLYELIMEKLVGCINEELYNEVDANRHRHSGHIYEVEPEKIKIIDCFSLEIANKHLSKKFGTSIKNMNDDSLINIFKISAIKTRQIYRGSDFN
jgi:hypothetical protein